MDLKQFSNLVRTKFWGFLQIADHNDFINARFRQHF